MKIDTQQLSPMTLHGVRVAFKYSKHTPYHRTFDDWLASTLKREEDGLAHAITEMSDWCDQVCSGRTQPHYAELSLKDQKALVVAHGVFKTMNSLAT